MSPSSVAILCATSGRTTGGIRDASCSANPATLRFLRNSSCASSASSSRRKGEGRVQSRVHRASPEFKLTRVKERATHSTVKAGGRFFPRPQIGRTGKGEPSDRESKSRAKGKRFARGGRKHGSEEVAGPGNDAGEGWSKPRLRRPEVAGPGSDGGEEASSAMAGGSRTGERWRRPSLVCDGGGSRSERAAMAGVAARTGQRRRGFRGRKRGHIPHVPCQTRTGRDKWGSQRWVNTSRGVGRYPHLYSGSTVCRVLKDPKPDPFKKRFARSRHERDGERDQQKGGPRPRSTSPRAPPRGISKEASVPAGDLSTPHSSFPLSKTRELRSPLGGSPPLLHSPPLAAFSSSRFSSKQRERGEMAFMAVLESDLRALSAEARRRYPAVKDAAEHAILKKKLEDPLKQIQSLLKSWAKGEEMSKWSTFSFSSPQRQQVVEMSGMKEANLTCARKAVLVSDSVSVVLDGFGKFKGIWLQRILFRPWDTMTSILGCTPIKLLLCECHPTTSSSLTTVTISSSLTTVTTSTSTSTSTVTTTVTSSI
ncbi:hypothetical protein Taro_011489 [Colocasia esculenta]|uniref:Uncharacterized protein n=1 Tax=Colocasia esculenta TaxID=4460 RepID=A0A843U610_COLES|nr:hypothetical protein [Colocasia esculenta]